LGLDLRLPVPPPGNDSLRTCFGETTGCLLVEVGEAGARAFEAYFSGLHCQPIGAVTSELSLRIKCGQQKLIDLPVGSLLAGWRPEID